MLIRIGTRGSALALAQSRNVARWLEERTGATTELLTVRTSGDRLTQVPLQQFAGVGAFTKEIDLEQREGLFEVSVHSLKDLPTTGREGLVLGAVPERAPVEDCLISRGGLSLADLPAGATLGTGSPRRRAQLARVRPDLAYEGIRGNVGTRLRKVADGTVDATLLARAGLVRLGFADEITQVLPLETMIPAAGQGALAIVVREGESEALDAVRQLEDAATRAEVDAERAVLGVLGGGCHLPLGVLAQAADGRLVLRARAASQDGALVCEETAEADLDAAAELGRLVGERLVAAGARELLQTT